jgi:hypothetical protein
MVRNSPELIEYEGSLLCSEYPRKVSVLSQIDLVHAFYRLTCKAPKRRQLYYLFKTRPSDTLFCHMWCLCLSLAGECFNLSRVVGYHDRGSSYFPSHFIKKTRNIPWDKSANLLSRLLLIAIRDPPPPQQLPATSLQCNQCSWIDVAA